MQGANQAVYFEMELSEDNMKIGMEEGPVKKFRPTTTIGTTSMHLFEADGTISEVLTFLNKADSLVAHFEYHKHPITSIEWSPHEPSTLAVSSPDHQLILWDLSVEKDPEEEAEFRAKMKKQANAPEDFPPQLLFVHQGQKDLKELHWHPQIPSMIISTAADSFNVLMPSNIDTTIPGNADTTIPPAGP